MTYKILVTGGAGFIGSEVVRQLVNWQSSSWASRYSSLLPDAIKVIVVDNLVNGQASNLANVLGESCQLVVADIRDQAKMALLLQDVNLVLHLACLGVRHSIHSPHENHDVNASATLSLLTLARQTGVARFVYVSSSEVYGSAHWTPMTEEHPTFPLTVYGASKLAGECYTRAFYETYSYSTVVVRPFNAYGPRCHHEGDSGEVIPKFLLRGMAGQPMIIFGNGQQTRDFTYVSDTARGIIVAGFAEQAIGQTINLGSGREITIQDLAAKVAAVLGQSHPQVIYDDPRPGDVLRLYAETTKAQRLLGFEARISLAEGLMRLRDWYTSLGRSPHELLQAEQIRNWEQGAVKNHA